MTTYPFASPPPSPGVYLIRNTQTGQVYIGQSMDLRRRFNEWRSVFLSRLGVKSFRLLGAVTDAAPENWEFTVLTVMPGASKEELSKLEDRAIQRVFDKAPDKALNTLAGGTVAKPLNPTGAGPLSVLTHGGKQVGYEYARRLLGCSPKQLQKRLRRHREKGHTVVALEELIELSEKYRA